MYFKKYKLTLDSKNENSDKNSSLKFRFKINKGRNIRYFLTKSEFIILKEDFKKRSLLSINKINLDKEFNIKREKSLNSKDLLDLSSCSSTNDLFTNENNGVITNKNEIFVIALNLQFVFVDLNSKTVLNKFTFNERSKMLNQISNLRNTSKQEDNIVCLSSWNSLIYIDYNLSLNRVLIYDSFDDLQQRIFVSFVVDENKLVAYDESNRKLIGFYLNSSNESPFKNLLFEIQLLDSKLETFGLSINGSYIYLIENQKVLKFYRWNEITRIAETFLFMNTNNVLCTDEYICMSMQDRKIISFLIVDSTVTDSDERIRRLDSRSNQNNKVQTKALKQLVEENPWWDQSFENDYMAKRLEDQDPNSEKSDQLVQKIKEKKPAKIAKTKLEEETEKFEMSNFSFKIVLNIFLITVFPCI